MDSQKKQNEENKRNFSGLEKYARYSGMAFQMVAVLLFFVWLGLKLDEKIQPEKPLFVIILSILGVFVALYVALRDFIHPKEK